MTSFKLDLEVIKDIEQYRERHAITQNAMAKKLGLSSVTRFTKYVNLANPENQPEQDAERVQSACRQFLRHERHLSEAEAELYECPVVEEFTIAMNTVITTADLSLFWGPAGAGKTSAAIFFRAKNPGTILITASHDQCDWRAMRNLVFHEVSSELDSGGQPYSGSQPRWEWILNLLRGTERPIIVDAGERLKLTALEWFCDLNDATRTPVMFVANDDLLDVARRSDRVSSRIGKVTKATIESGERKIARQLIQKFAPESGELFVEGVEGLLAQGGQARRAAKQLRLTATIYPHLDKPDWSEAWQAATSQLLRPNWLAKKK
jgi:DNA transposition AAA+ family ATPase